MALSLTHQGKGNTVTVHSNRKGERDILLKGVAHVKTEDPDAFTQDDDNNEGPRGMSTQQ